jgi:hypothetical protein
MPVHLRPSQQDTPAGSGQKSRRSSMSNLRSKRNQNKSTPNACACESIHTHVDVGHDGWCHIAFLGIGRSATEDCCNPTQAVSESIVRRCTSGVAQQPSPSANNACKRSTCCVLMILLKLSLVEGSLQATRIINLNAIQSNLNATTLIHCHTVRRTARWYRATLATAAALFVW